MPKKESESQKSHRVFKWYKARGDFPNDVSLLEAYRLLSKYNYFIARDLNKKTINTLTEICNILNREKMILVFGDFLLETLYFGLNSFKHGLNKIKIVYIDSIEDKPDSIISTASITSSHFKNYIIYVVDNVDHLTKKQSTQLLKIKEDIENNNKSIICCSMALNKVNPLLKNGVKKIKLGNYYDNKMNLKKYVYQLFNNTNREEVLEHFTSTNINIKYFLKLAMHNISQFYEKDIQSMQHNISVIQTTNTFLYKTTTEYVLKYLIFGIHTINIKRVVRFPPTFEPQKIMKKRYKNGKMLGRNVKPVKTS